MSSHHVYLILGPKLWSCD